MTLQVNLNPKLIKEIEIRSRDLKIGTDELITKALENYLYFDQLNFIRGKLKNRAKEAGILSEDDLQEQLS